MGSSSKFPWTGSCGHLDYNDDHRGGAFDRKRKRDDELPWITDRAESNPVAEEAFLWWGNPLPSVYSHDEV